MVTVPTGLPAGDDAAVAVGAAADGVGDCAIEMACTDKVSATTPATITDSLIGFGIDAPSTACDPGQDANGDRWRRMVQPRARGG